MLSGLRVIEFEGLGPAPFAGMMLAELGAEVIVIHRPRPSGPTADGPALLDRGKRSIVLDLKEDSDLALAMELIASADALIEGLRPGVMERLGLGPETCHRRNPKLVYGRMTGWGQEGPRAQMAGHDLNYIATSGALWYASRPGEAPVTPPTLVGDIGGGALYLVAGILSGLLQAARAGHGTVVDAAIVDGSAHMMALLMSMAPFGHLQEARGQSLLDGPHWCRSYLCADGQWITVQCLEPQFYDAFLKGMGLQEDADFADQHDQTRWSDLAERLALIFATQSASHWAQIIDHTDACVAPVLSPWGAARDAHMRARGVWQEAGGTLAPAPAPRFDGRISEVAPPVARGADGDAIRRELARGQ